MVTPTLRERRKRLRLSLAELAQRVGISESQLSRIERGGGTTTPVLAAIERELDTAKAA